MRKAIGSGALLACALLVLLGSSDAEASSLGRLHRERLEVGRALIEAQSSNWQSILPYYTADIEYHDPVVDIYGIDMMTEFLGRLFTSSGDLVTTIEDETLLNGVYSASWTMVGQFNGVPYSAKGISIIKFRGLSKRVYYQRDYYSENDIMINIPGLDQAAIGFRTYYRCAVDPTFECPLEAGATTIKPTDNLPSADKSWNSIVSAIRLRRERLEIGRALIEINNADWQSLLPYYTNDIEYHDPIVDIYGIDTLVPFLGRLFASSGDLITTVEDESLVDGVYTATWTMAGLFNGIPYSAKGMSILKFRPGSAQAYYSRDYYTEGDIMATVPGLDQAIGGFRTYYRCAVDPTFDCPLPPAGALAAGPVKSDTPAASSVFSLQQNAPNPFNPTTEISFAVPDGGANVSLRVYDITGRLVRTLVEGNEPAGTRTVTWSGDNDQGQRVPSGTYFYRLTAPSFSEQKKMVLLK
jgi:hypothetical protein